MSVQDVEFFQQTFLSSLSNFEKCLLDFTGNSRTVDIFALLGVNAVIPEAEGNRAVIPTHKPSFTLFDFQKICSVLCAYRFFDIISLRAVSRVSASPPIPMFLPESPGSPAPKEELYVSLEHLLFLNF
jgi:hypothetical protein